MRTLVLAALLFCTFAFAAQAKKVKPFYFPGSEEVLHINNARIDAKGLSIDSKIIANFGKKLKSIYVYKIKDKNTAIRIEVKKPPIVERIEVDFSSTPASVKRFLKKKGKWIERKDVNEALIAR